VQKLDDLHQYLRDKNAKAIAQYKEFADRHRILAPDYSVGDCVWLSTRNIRMTRLMRKFTEQRLGPFAITEVITAQAMRLELPKELRMLHPVFHVSLLEPHTSSDILGRTQSPPPAVEIEDEEEWEVEEVRRKKLQYLVRWTDLRTTRNDV
jgi:hypothetical protein